jgi:hypothetical protein
MDSKNITLVIFTCEGREHLLLRSFESFSKSCKTVFSNKLLAIDGKISQATIDTIAPDIVIQSTARNGYVNSIINALKNINTEYFFWLEDDWKFPYEFSVESLLPVFDDAKVLQIIFAKGALNAGFKLYQTTDLYINDFGFSANPALCRTSVMKDVFNEVVAFKKDEESKFLSFEYFVSKYSERNGLLTLVKYHDNQAFVNHVGELESTAREYHMINSVSIPIKQGDKDYISGLKREKNIRFHNKAGLFIKLYGAIIYLSIKLFFSRQAYDFAFRVYIASLRRFKH